jgi:SAM-dependent methyltransferase
MRSESERLDARDDWDRHWDEYSQAAQTNPAQEYRRRMCFSLLGLKEPGTGVRLLDIGSGQGDMAAAVHAAYPAAEIVGLELSESGVQISRQKVPSARFVQCNLLEQSAAAENLKSWATHALCSEVIEHVDDPCRLLSNARKFMSSSCVLVVTAPGGPMSAFDKHIGHRRHFTPADLGDLFRHAGYEPNTTAGSGFPFFNLYKCVVVLRGKKLIDDVSARQNASASPLARITMAAFRVLFNLNFKSTPWGWQTVGKAQAFNASAS